MKNKIIIFSSNNSNGSTLIARFYSYFLSLLNYKVCMVNVSNIVKLINMDSSNDGKYSKNYLFFSKILSVFKFIYKENGFYHLNIFLDSKEVSDSNKIKILKNSIVSLRKKFDYVIIDLENIDGSLLSNLSESCDDIILVTCPDQNSKTFINNQNDKIRKKNPNAHTYVLFNKVKTNSSFHEDYKNKIKLHKDAQGYTVLENSVRDSVDVQRLEKVYFDSKHGSKKIKSINDLKKVSLEIMVRCLDINFIKKI